MKFGKEALSAANIPQFLGKGLLEAAKLLDMALFIRKQNPAFYSHMENFAYGLYKYYRMFAKPPQFVGRQSEVATGLITLKRDEVVENDRKMVRHGRQTTPGSAKRSTLESMSTSVKRVVFDFKDFAEVGLSRSQGVAPSYNASVAFLKLCYNGSGLFDFDIVNYREFKKDLYRLVLIKKGAVDSIDDFQRGCYKYLKTDSVVESFQRVLYLPYFYIKSNQIKQASFNRPYDFCYELYEYAEKTIKDLRAKKDLKAEFAYLIQGDSKASMAQAGMLRDFWISKRVFYNVTWYRDESEIRVDKPLGSPHVATICGKFGDASLCFLADLDIFTYACPKRLCLSSLHSRILHRDQEMYAADDPNNAYEYSRVAGYLNEYGNIVFPLINDIVFDYYDKVRIPGLERPLPFDRGNFPKLFKHGPECTYPKSTKYPYKEKCLVISPIPLFGQAGDDGHFILIESREDFISVCKELDKKSYITLINPKWIHGLSSFWGRYGVEATPIDIREKLYRDLSSIVSHPPKFMERPVDLFSVVEKTKVWEGGRPFLLEFWNASVASKLLMEGEVVSESPEEEGEVGDLDLRKWNVSPTFSRSVSSDGFQQQGQTSFVPHLNLSNLASASSSGSCYYPDGSPASPTSPVFSDFSCASAARAAPPPTPIAAGGPPVGGPGPPLLPPPGGAGVGHVPPGGFPASGGVPAPGASGYPSVAVAPSSSEDDVPSYVRLAGVEHSRRLGSSSKQFKFDPFANE